MNASMINAKPVKLLFAAGFALALVTTAPLVTGSHAINGRALASESAHKGTGTDGKQGNDHVASSSSQNSNDIMADDDMDGDAGMPDSGNDNEKPACKTGTCK